VEKLLSTFDPFKRNRQRAKNSNLNVKQSAAAANWSDIIRQ